VVAWMLVATAKFVAATPAVDWLRPFYDPATFSWATFSTGTSLAVLTYIGFDGISTLSEEVKDPRRNILLGTVYTCLIIGALSAVQCYAAQLIWPGTESFPDIDTAYVHIAGRAGGPWLFQAINLTLLVATVGSGMGAVMAGARLMYGMGRDHALPNRFFAALDPARGVPKNNVLLIGGLALAGAFAMSYQLGAELLNFGAFIGFMGVNLSALTRYWIRATDRRLTNLVPPILGFLICLYLWLSLSMFAKIAGVAWLLVGLIAYSKWHAAHRNHRPDSDSPDASAGGLSVARAGRPAFAGKLHRRLCKAIEPGVPARCRRSKSADAVDGRHHLYRQGRCRRHGGTTPGRRRRDAGSGEGQLFMASKRRTHGRQRALPHQCLAIDRRHDDRNGQ